MFRALSKLIFWIIGWKVTGILPGGEVKKSVLIEIPHTSSWDFLIGILTRSILNVSIKYVMKNSMFKPPFGWFFRWTDGMPVDRSKSNNFVDGVINLYNQRDNLHIILSPEGTRKHVDNLKTGFYYIALGAKIPIHMVGFDYENKEVRFREPFYPSGDKEKDFAVIRDYYKNIKGKNPENSWAYEAKKEV